jgi:GTP-binding protein
VNKCDTEARRAAAVDFFELGLGSPFAVSAIHGTDVGDLLDAVVDGLPDSDAQEDESVKIAIVGKPNAGKSSLLNRLVGAERAIVSPVAGTTRDAVDTVIDVDGVAVTLIDTAGIRRRGKVERGVEQFSVLRSFKAIERADVVLLVIDAVAGLSAQDAHIAGFVVEAARSCVLLVNKWDAIPGGAGVQEQFAQQVRQDLKFIDYAPLHFISAKTGAGVDEVLPMALRVQEERLVRLSTSKINRILVQAQDRQAPPAHAGRQLKLLYGTQVRADPPTFMIYVNDPALLHFSYRRFLENRFRDEYGFLGTPIRIVAKGRREKSS